MLRTNTNQTLTEELFIFQRMTDGDHHALKFFFEKYYEDLCNYVNLYVGDKTVSEDIVQDIFIYFWEKREIISLDSSVKSYLLKASRNRYLNHLRNEKSHQLISREVISGRDTYVNPDYNHFDTGQIESFINAAVDKLPPRCREVYKLHKYDELSYKEIASRMDITEKTVENQMTIAIKKLREYLAPFYKEIFALLMIGLFGK
jgi:RNA polymerase sigma-70 factor, ECF subfamily